MNRGANRTARRGLDGIRARAWAKFGFTAPRKSSVLLTRFGIPASKVEWYHVTLTEMYAMCDPKHESFPNGGLGGCAFYIGKGGTCYVYSMYSEWEAHRVMSGDGLTLYEHEVGDREKPDRPFGHCNGWVHTNPLPKR